MDSHTKVDSQEPVAPVDTLPLSKYSNRVELKSILGRSDGGAGLAGERVVIGGWVKSSKEQKSLPLPPHPRVDRTGMAAGSRDVSCVEIIQSRITLFKKIINAFGGGSHYHDREKLDSPVQKPDSPRPSTLYLLISDGSSVYSLQVVMDSAILSWPVSQLLSIGTCIVADGILRHPSVLGKHAIELKALQLLHVGTVDEDKYPLSKKKLPLHMLRDFSHFKPRTTTVASVTRIRSALTFATHTFFQSAGFQYVQLPIITTTDCDGFSEKFQVTTLLGKASTDERKAIVDNDKISLDVVKNAIKEKSSLIEELKRTGSNREALVTAVRDLQKTNELASQLEARQKSKAGTFTKGDKYNFSDDFFSQETYLTVSGRLHLESYACALGNVYSFGPRFRADRVENARHVAEMWNVETEMAFSQLDDAMNCAYDYFKFLCKYILENCSEDLKFISKRTDKKVIDRIESVTMSSIKKLSYTAVMDILQKVTDKKFEIKPEWGYALTTEHISYLADDIFKCPVTIYNYPKAVKPFYVRMNDDEKTVAAFDMIVPKVGTLITGSQNEERIDKLDSRIEELCLPREQYEWYLDLRRHGTVKHSGFSVRYELLVLFATGLPDVRDAIPFPRSLGKAIN